MDDRERIDADHCDCGTLFSHRVWRWLLAWTDTSILARIARRRNYRYSFPSPLRSLCNHIDCPFGPKNIELEHEHQVAGGELDNERSESFVAP